MGARSGYELREALEIHDPAAVKVLLHAGADPNQLIADGRSLMAFDDNQTLRQHFRLLTERGMSLNMMDGDDPHDVELAIHQRWDRVVDLIKRSANSRKPRADDRRTVASVLTQQIDEDTNANKALPPDLPLVHSLIDGNR